jgi:N-methylhydantoinase A
MLAFGGSGPVHAAFVAARLALPGVLIPPSAGILSAYGCAIGRVSTQVVRSYARPLSHLEPQGIADVYSRLRDEAYAMLDVAQDAADVELSYFCDMQYTGQRSTLTLPAPATPDLEAIQSLATRFHSEYRRRFGRSLEWVPVKAINWRVRASLRADWARPPGSVEQPTSPDGRSSTATRRPIFVLGEGMVEAAVFSRPALRPGWHTRGPAVIEEFDTTIVVPAGHSARVLDNDCVLLQRTTP